MGALPRIVRIVGTTFAETVKAIAWRAEKFQDRNLEALQRNLVDLAMPAAVLPIGGGNLILEQPFSPFQPTVVAHLLGRAFVGAFVGVPYMASGSHLPPSFWIVAQGASLDDKQVTIGSTATCTAPVYVF